MQKIILFYKFTPLSDPEAVRLWQQTLADSLGLNGRIIIADQGINGTLGGDLQALKRYVQATMAYPSFDGMEFKWSDGRGDHFPKLSVKVRPEIVTFGAKDKISIDGGGVVGGGKRLKPHELHRLVAERGADVVFFDGRNNYEAAVGKFKNAVIPAVEHSRDMADELDDPKYEGIKDKPVVTYCTGGIRCEVLSALMKQRGFKEVYQLDGGIVGYGETYADDGLWEGALYVFDGRVTAKFSDRARDIGRCIYCDTTTSRYANCAEPTCNARILVCGACAAHSLCPVCQMAALKV